jgi:3-hydroxymyristoyl/3-hydroxydecanoyl-(acyl carrier protein) dehydratase
MVDEPFKPAWLGFFVMHESLSAAVKKPLYERSDLAQVFLPVGNMLQIDRVTEIADDRITCEMDLPGHWVFPLHFPGDAIFPGCLMIEAAGQAVAIWGWHSGLRGKPRMARVEAEYKSPVTPEDKMITLVGTIRQKRGICLGSVDLLACDKVVAVVKPIIAVV